MSKKKSATAHRILHALGNKTRLQIAEVLLANKELGVGDLNAKLNSLNSRKMGQPGISQHLTKLRQCGLVSNRREHREIFYKIANPVVADIVKAAKKAAA